MERIDFLPVSREDLRERGWYYYDFLLVTGDEKGIRQDQRSMCIQTDYPFQRRRFH